MSRTPAAFATNICFFCALQTEGCKKPGDHVGAGFYWVAETREGKGSSKEVDRRTADGDFCNSQSEWRENTHKDEKSLKSRRKHEKTLRSLRESRAGNAHKEFWHPTAICEQRVENRYAHLRRWEANQEDSAWIVARMARMA